MFKKVQINAQTSVLVEVTVKEVTLSPWVRATLAAKVSNDLGLTARAAIKELSR